MSICILSKYLGALWAGRILKDWGCQVTTQLKNSDPKIIITDQTIKSQHVSNSLRVILTDISISSPHLLAQSGVLSTFGQLKDVFVPRFLVQTTVSNALAILCLQKLYQVKNENQPLQENFYFSIIQILKYFGAFNISAKFNTLLQRGRGENMLQGGAPYYSVYLCKQGQVVVGNLEPKFYQQMVKGLDLAQKQRQFLQNAQFVAEDWPKMRSMLSQKFLQKTAKEWDEYFKAYDTCITQIKAPFKSIIREPKLTCLSPKL